MLGAVVPAYNVPGVTGEVKFTPEALSGIFLGKISKWNDKAITAANPGVNFPDRDIIVVHRSDGSGTTFIWTDYLSKVSAEWKSQVGSDTSVKWPIGMGGKGNEGVAGMIRQTVGLDRVRRIDLRRAKQNSIRQREKRGRELSSKRLWKRNCGGRFSAKDAGGFPGLDHECPWEGCLSDFQLHLAADPGPIEGALRKGKFWPTS